MVAAGSAVVLLAESATGGSVVSWGNNLYGQTNVPPSLSNSVAVSGGGNHSGALRSDGTVVAWGGNAYIQTNVPPSVTNVVAIATGANHSLALRADGRVLVWGSINTTLTNVPAVLSNAVAISAGDTFSMGLQINGTVTAWGMSTYQLTNLPAGLSNVVAISAGKDHGIALRSDGTVIAWGNNSSGQTNVPAGLSNVASVAAGDSFSVAMLADGTVTAWGLGSRTNVPADLSNVVAVAAGGSHSLALREDGTMRSWGIGPQTNVPSGLSNVIAIAAGSGHSLSLFGDAIPVISRQPEGLSIGAGPGVTLRAVVTGRPPLSFQWQKNGTNLVDDGNIRGSKSATLALISAQFSDSGNYSLIVSNAHGMTVTSNALVAVIELPDAVDATNMTWATGGDSPWFPQSTVTHDGVDAARSGYLAHKKTNWIQTDVVGPGVLSFWWKVSSELDYDFVRCFQNGVPAAAISGEVGWEQGSLYLGTGTNTVRWQYAKDDSVAGVQDAAWLDEVVLISGGTAPQIVTQPVGTNVVAGLSAILNVGLIGTPPFVSQWLLNGAVVLGGTNTTLNVINVQNTDVGDYRVVVSNGASVFTHGTTIGSSGNSNSMVISGANLTDLGAIQIGGSNNSFTVSAASQVSSQSADFSGNSKSSF